jgi:hypothetical protein
VEDPKIMITTSRDPSSKLKQFAKVNLDFYKLEKRMFFLTFPDSLARNVRNLRRPSGISASAKSTSSSRRQSSKRVRTAISLNTVAGNA